ncbi:alcohol dehydrogenase [Paraphoma chrysanthemicola]|uniref:Alcohol dehydrogenase n=1 Tax=Paraphoma chrysanthemicola TaxID=798071 RepID=A0A8K0RF97_9PLEO|nr:alcohol dehydrogenase [Paraphoma chrysanthemicola]
MSSLPETHSAIVQTIYAHPLELKSLPTPQPTPGCAIIRTHYAPIFSYTKDIFNGKRGYPYPTPLVPGSSGIGRIAALGPDATSLEIGQLVFIDSMIRSRDDPTDAFLMGITQGGTKGGAKLMKDVWRNGTYAEYVAVPLENVAVLNEEKLLGKLGYKESDLAGLARYAIPYGGLRDIGLEVGETIIVTPATGAFGGAAVAMALAMGAKVIAAGRNEEKLKGLVEQFGEERVKTVKITENVADHVGALQQAAGGPIDAVFEISPPMAAKSTHLKSAILALRHGGRVSLMGGILEDYAVPFRDIMRKNLVLRGKWMYERADLKHLVRMVENGILKIGERGGVKTVGEYGFGDWEEAFEVASKEAGWDSAVILRAET